jgi:hypothetical protein
MVATKLPPAQPLTQTHNLIFPMIQKDLLSAREQIQQDILSYASTIDDEKIFFNNSVLTELCQIVVNNFDKLAKASVQAQANDSLVLSISDALWGEGADTEWGPDTLNAIADAIRNVRPELAKS